MNDKSKIEKHKAKILAIILVIYIYVPYFANILENTFQLSALYEYIIYIVLAMISIMVTMRINKRVLIFLLIFGLLISVNCILVTYQYYVFIEGIQALIGIMIPCLCVSNKIFNLKIFIKIWFKVSKLNFPLVLAGVVLLKYKLVTYAIFTGICVPNAFITAYMVLQGIEKRKWLYVNAVINILTIVAFGGRTASVISICMIFFAVLYSGKIKLWKKLITVIISMVIGYILLNNYIDILYWINDQFVKYGINSRNTYVFLYQIKSDDIYLTNRDYIYKECLEYIKERLGLPGGFGIPLYITLGEYYYTHNVALQFLTFFGVWGTIIVIIMMLIRVKSINKIASFKCKEFMYFMLFSYAGIGMTGSSIWIHYLATIFIAIFFFGNKKLYNTI